MIDTYAAGLIDGEGYIGIQQAGGSFQVRLKVTMTDKGMIALRRMERMHGGRIDGPRVATESRRESYSWRLTGTKASALVAELRPHLLVKAQPADIALAFQAMVDGSPRLPNGRATWTDEMRQRAAVFVQRIQEANRRGPNADAPPLPTGWSPLAIRRWGTWWDPEPDLFGPVEFAGKIPRSGLMISGHIYQTD